MVIFPLACDEGDISIISLDFRFAKIRLREALVSKECSKQNIRKVRRRRLNFVSLGRVGSHSHALLRKYPPLCVQWTGHTILRGDRGGLSVLDLLSLRGSVLAAKSRRLGQVHK